MPRVERLENGIRMLQCWLSWGLEWQPSIVITGRYETKGGKAERCRCLKFTASVEGKGASRPLRLLTSSQPLLCNLCFKYHFPSFTLHLSDPQRNTLWFEFKGLMMAGGGEVRGPHLRGIRDNNNIRWPHWNHTVNRRNFFNSCELIFPFPMCDRVSSMG